MSALKPGDFVHVVATVNLDLVEGKILYVNPSKASLETDAPRDPNVELVIKDLDGRSLHREAVVVRQPACEGGSTTSNSLVQADLPKVDGMNSISLVVNHHEVSQFVAGKPLSAPQNLSLGLSKSGPSIHRRQLTLGQAFLLNPSPGVSYSIQVKPDSGGPWNTIAVGRPTPKIEIDRNQFSGARQAEVKVLRTTGFDEEIIAQEIIDLF